MISFIIMISPRFSGRKTLALEVPLQNKNDFQCDLASIYKIPGPKIQSTAIEITTGGIHRYCSRPVGSTPSNSLEQPGPGNSFEGRYSHQGLKNLAQNEAGDGTLNIQEIHGATTTVASDGPTTNATTTFISDAAVVQSLPLHNKGPTLSIAKKSQVVNVEDIKKFLSKPFRLASNIFQVGDTVSAFPAYEGLTYMFYLNPMYLNKIYGFQGIRGTLVYRLILNANRFQQGRYMLAWVPTGGLSPGSTRGGLIHNARINTLTQRSQLQRVEVDLNCDTEAELRIPFSSALNWYPFSAVTNSVASLGEVGKICIFPYVALTNGTGGSQTASWTLYAHLEDVELFGATVPQMGDRMGKVVKRKTASEQEAKNADVGPVESAFIVLTGMANALSIVPSLAPFATPASWVTEAMAGAAASLGWSKPSHLAPATRMFLNNAPYMGSVDNDDYSLPLSLSVNNSVETVAGMHMTDKDELDFNAICSIFAWVATFGYSTGSTVGTNLWTSEVSPSSYSVTSGLYIHYTPLTFVSSYFNYWRGSIIYKFKIVKTEFHSGRISVTFTPRNSVGPTTGATTFATTPYLIKEVYDIRECNEIIFKVPYQSEQPYLHTNNIYESYASIGKVYASGVVNVWVEDLLVSPPTVNSSISFIVEVCGGPDMEFAYPCPAFNSPVLGITPQMGERAPRNDCRLDDSNLAMFSQEDQVEAASKCMGERIRSFRSLMKAYSVINPPLAETPTAFTTVFPFFTSCVYETTTPVLGNSCDIWGTLHGVFLYSRGGVRWLFDQKDYVTNPAAIDTARDVKVMAIRFIHQQVVTTPVVNAATLDGFPSPLRYAGNGLKVLGRISNGEPLQVSVPALNQMVARVCSDYLVNPSVANDTGVINSLTNADIVGIGPNTSTPANLRQYVKYRAGADDADFSGFVSIMPMRYSQGNTS